MKNRNLFTNILSILILVSLVFFLLIQFNVFKAITGKLQDTIVLVTLGVAVLSVICIDIVFPIIDNRDRLKEKKYLILFIIKVVLFLAAIVVLLLFHPFAIIKSAAPALIGFIVLYFAQFFINLDSKPSDEDDDEDDDGEDYEDADEDEEDAESVEDEIDEVESDESVEAEEVESDADSVADEVDSNSDSDEIDDTEN